MKGYKAHREFNQRQITLNLQTLKNMKASWVRGISNFASQDDDSEEEGNKWSEEEGNKRWELRKAALGHINEMCTRLERQTKYYTKSWTYKYFGKAIPDIRTVGTFKALAEIPNFLRDIESGTVTIDKLKADLDAHKEAFTPRPSVGARIIKRIQQVSFVGGVTAAAGVAGAIGGAIIGGPFAPIAIPIGAAVGAAIAAGVGTYIHSKRKTTVEKNASNFAEKTLGIKQFIENKDDLALGQEDALSLAAEAPLPSDAISISSSNAFASDWSDEEGESLGDDGAPELVSHERGAGDTGPLQVSSEESIYATILPKNQRNAATIFSLPHSDYEDHGYASLNDLRGDASSSTPSSDGNPQASTSATPFADFSTAELNSAAGNAKTATAFGPHSRIAPLDAAVADMLNAADELSSPAT
jgi:hypothetical protein